MTRNLQFPGVSSRDTVVSFLDRRVIATLFFQPAIYRAFILLVPSIQDVIDLHEIPVLGRVNHLTVRVIHLHPQRLVGRHRHPERDRGVDVHHLPVTGIGVFSREDQDNALERGVLLYRQFTPAVRVPVTVYHVSRVAIRDVVRLVHHVLVPLDVR